MTKPIDTNKPVQTTCGLKARIICTDRKGERPIIALIEDAYGIEDMCSFNPDGSGPRFTLINVPKRITGWQNIYLRDGMYRSGTRIWTSLEEANLNAAVDWAQERRVGCIYVDFSEGEGLE